VKAAAAMGTCYTRSTFPKVITELETQLLLSGRLRFLSDQDLRGLFDQCEEVGRILNGLMKTVKNRIRAKRMKE
jgi:hypothetical protein